MVTNKKIYYFNFWYLKNIYKKKDPINNKLLFFKLKSMLTKGGNSYKVFFLYLTICKILKKNRFKPLIVLYKTFNNYSSLLRIHISKKNRIKNIASPYVLHMNQRVNSMMKSFNNILVKRKETFFLQRFFFEVLDMLSRKSAFLKVKYKLYFTFWKIKNFFGSNLKKKKIKFRRFSFKVLVGF